MFRLINDIIYQAKTSINQNNEIIDVEYEDISDKVNTNIDENKNNNINNNLIENE